MKIKKNATEAPTLEQRGTAAAATAGAAISMFAAAADDLEFAATEQDEIAYLANEEITYLELIRFSAENEAEDARTIASKIRALVSL